MKKIVFVLPALIYLQTATLQAIACQNPFEGGNAVYSARVMLGIEWACPNYNKTGGNAYYEPITEEPPEKNKETENAFIGKIYPNPNDGRMRLDYYLEEGQRGELEIVDVSGRLVKRFSLSPIATTLLINERAIHAGIYFYKIFVDEELMLADKLIIINR